MTALQRSPTIPVVLPGCAYFMGVGHAPARRMLEADLPLALASDCNPGSCMIESLPLIMNIACTQLRMLPIEVLVAVTANAAAAIGRQDRAGAMQVGREADLVVLDVPSIEQWMYEPGRDCVRSVVKRGVVVSGTHPE
jgi:imidazolonepropionase